MNPFSSSLSTSSSSKTKRDPNSLDESYICKRPNYDLFVSYLYEDIGETFISHVRGALDRNGFTISDHTKVPEGQEVSCCEVLKAIEESEICVLVFSPKYASSVRCLNELAHIVGCRDKLHQKKVFPVFFNVDPHDVRKQEGPFKEAFEAHTTNFDHHRVQKWREALKKAGGISGEHYKNGDVEERVVREIVKKLQSMQNPPQIYFTDHHVGIEIRAKKCISRLRLDLKDVSMIVAVLGIGGIGKTTIARAVYDMIAAGFDASCFLDDIHECSDNPTLKVDKQKSLIYSLSQNNNLPVIISSTFEGVAMIRRLTRGRKVLLVLDDVTHVSQLEAFGIDPFKTSLLNRCFGGGSRIIMTTRDKRSLGSLSYVPYNMKQLNMEESIQLLTRLMYEKDDHPIKHMKFSKEIAWCASGLPLVLKVWSLHFRHHEREEWPKVLKTLKTIPLDDVHKKLKISYDSLTNRAKKLFLDIACFFHGKEKNAIVNVLEDEESGFFPDHEIQCLADRGLVKFRSNYRGSTEVLMHEAIREMGLEIVRQENEDDPGQRTRLTKPTDVRCVLEECSGTRSVQSICYADYLTVDIEAFRNMKNLRLIRLAFVALCSSVPRNLLLGCCDSDEGMPPPPLSFPKLKYLEWADFPMESIDIDMCNVVVIWLKWSRLKTLWKKGSKPMKKLKILDVTYSKDLTKTGSFNGLQNLESLNFYDCEKLEELDSSVCCLDKLVRLNLKGCSGLKRFPFETIGKLRSLKELDLRGCVGIGFEDDEVIKAFMSSLKETHITRLMLCGCNIYKLPSEVGSLTRLKHLNLGGSKFHSLPDSLGQLDQLETLRLSHCRRLQSIPDLPPSVCSIEAQNCESLTTLPSNLSQLTCLEELNLYGCKFLTSLPSGMSELTSLEKLDLNGCECLTSLPSGMSGLTCLKKLDLRGCFKLGTEEDRAESCVMKLTGLTSVTVLEMGNCNVSQVPIEIGNLVSLWRLDLSGNTFSSLPDTFCNLLQLRYLTIKDCSELTSLPLLPPFLEEIKATGCLALDVMRSASSVVIDNFYPCPTPPSTNRDQYLSEFSKCVLAAYKETSFHSRLEILISGNEVPKWCHYIGTRHGESFMAPQLHSDMKISGMILCLRNKVEFNLQNKTKGTSYHLEAIKNFSSCTMTVRFIPLDNTTLIVEAGDEFAILYDKCFSEYGLCLIYKNKGDEIEIEMEPTTNIHVNQVDESDSEVEDPDFEDIPKYHDLYIDY